jgi:hypothetical protein
MAGQAKFGQYLQQWRDIATMKEDCGATARALAEAGERLNDEL